MDCSIGLAGAARLSLAMEARQWCIEAMGVGGGGVGGCVPVADNVKSN